MGDSQPNNETDDPRLAALLRWREELIAAGTVSPAAFKEAHIRLVLRSGRTDVDQLREMLPGAVAEHAEDMARVLSGAEPAGPTAAAERKPGAHRAPEAPVAPPAPDPSEATAMIRLPAPGTGSTPRIAPPVTLPPVQSGVDEPETSAMSGAPAPTEAPRPAEPAPTAAPRPEPVPQSGFAPFQFAPMPDRVPDIRLRRAPGGGLDLSWAEHPSGESHVIYRVVSSEESRGYSPDHGFQIAATREAAARDARALTSAIRHLQVWAYVGEDAAAAMAAQPVLHAAGVVVGGLSQVEVREDSGRVIGQWQAPPGVVAVHIYRMPAELASRAGAAFRIQAGTPNLTGFIDQEIERGRRYVYQLRCEVEVDGQVRLSDYVDADIRVSAVVVPVDDLSVTMHAERKDVVFDLEWTAPEFGRVLLYRTAEPPAAGARDSELEESALEHVGLPRSAMLTHPVAERREPDGSVKSTMAGVPWPHEWHRAYFTPVTVLDGRARLGRSESSVRTGLITDVSLVEYCNKQVLTFDWPQGAAAVRIFIAPKGHDPARGLTGRSFEISLADYERSGGMQFINDLPPAGCSLHLLPVAYSAGRPVQGAPASIEYGGLARLWYELRTIPDTATGMPALAAVRIRSENDMFGSPPFVMVHNPDRIPLSSTDGTPVDMVRLDDEGRPASGAVKTFQWSTLAKAGSNETWGGDVRGLTGWIRLFADLDPQRLRRFALLDPHVDALRLRGGQPQS
ncbi:putative ESX-1 scaffolding and assembly protein SaeA [Mycolicibacterium insubricum]|uniref:Uncharacterized protein n=1 Tax=Mycolicibacterium insubricum TaxID=444597 RepID=A0A1X0DDM3_9MYCO|nr:hypothetical protein [Mycolicibacterium insubricum]ORA70494.1 hypothetical protein BST26_10725 [Mycolicibacterium insubricum]BBZ64619.1 putative ESX-1 scaffolding and assembly protein SaeA [Mycolicibacterium insubricum]